MSFEFVAVEAEELESGERTRHTFEIRAPSDPTQLRAQLEELVVHAYPRARPGAFDDQGVSFVEGGRVIRGWVIQRAEVRVAAQDNSSRPEPCARSTIRNARLCA